MTPKRLLKELAVVSKALDQSGCIIDELLLQEGDEWGCYGPAMKQIHKAYRAIGRIKTANNAPVSTDAYQTFTEKRK